VQRLHGTGDAECELRLAGGIDPTRESALAAQLPSAHDDALDRARCVQDHRLLLPGAASEQKRCHCSGEKQIRHNEAEKARFLVHVWVTGNQENEKSRKLIIGAFEDYIGRLSDLKKKDNGFQRFYDHWILGLTSKEAQRRSSVIRDLLGWVE
jgi:hypothetical protein